MVQLQYADNIGFPPRTSRQFSVGEVCIFPQNIYGSISLLTVNDLIYHTISSLGSINYTVSLGLYSITGSTLTLANSFSVSGGSNNLVGNVTNVAYISFTSFSATSNLTPGTWFWGILASSNTTVGAAVGFYGAFTQGVGNSFPNKFIGGILSVSTNAVPASIAHTDVTQTGAAALFSPYILLSS